MNTEIDDSARIAASDLGQSEVREFVTIHDSTIGDGCRIYERCSLKNCSLGSKIDINAGSYVEHAEIKEEVQIGPNSSIVGVTHRLADTGMEFRNDMFAKIVVNEGAFIGAGATLTPGIEIGEQSVIAAGATVTEDVPSDTIVIGSPPEQQLQDLAAWTDR